LSGLRIIRMLQSARMEYAGHVARMEERCIQNFGGGNLAKRNYLDDLGVDGIIIIIIIKLIFTK